MKVVVLLGEGLGGEPVPDLNGKTALEAARTPQLDSLAARGILGLTRFVASARDASPDVGALCALGYDPTVHRIGRGTFEALGQGQTLAPGDVAFCADLVSVTVGADGVETLTGMTGGDVDPAVARDLGASLASALNDSAVELVPCASHRQLLIWHGGEARVRTVPPADAIGVATEKHLPAGPGADLLRDLMRRARLVLAAHPLTMAAAAEGRTIPNAMWIWGAGIPARLPSFDLRAGGPVTAVTTTARGRGLATLAKMTVVDASAATDPVPFITRAIDDADVCFIELTPFAATDLEPRAHDRVDVIERLDTDVVGPLLDHLRACGDDWRCLVLLSMPDPADQAAPFLLAIASDEKKTAIHSRRFHERDAREQGIFIPDAHSLMERLLRRA